MARPAYLHRRPDGRYCIQIRLGKRAQEIHGRPLLRVSLRTANFQEARRRLVVSLGWAVDIVKLPALNRQGQLSRRRSSSEPPVVKQMREVLLAARRRADTGELTS
ncbi:DUF6538 domain-containing protein [Bradyrhizobium diazoefficiens]|uniref:DUF6538 domain-containing protein n=1 Tax=Bradyrhizobium TaxID=374 RepID=UPI0005762D11|nr:hypothetical protein [Bradyrhizobium japonicum]PDT61828.1 hypothetical protein CO678_12915 [Bradyrhizobium diazoefficiens]BBZ97714.1 hypothetical protein F07S3_75470 [Bradyrhizobium diazoefficiens]BCA06767.1 hypothetical protein H12S4_76710 [Bradyrhizobium diazoefficiens]BCA15398.1 hypothetical protein BDHF08_72450 [Bradyrhizobium diazoefficiens]